MSLIRCPICNSQISESAENCPHCGYPISALAKLKSSIQPVRPKKTLVDAQCIYAWISIILGVIFIVAVPYNNFGGIVARASGTALIIIGLVWGFIIGLERWWHH